jgi:hypothetical protein
MRHHRPIIDLPKNVPTTWERLLCALVIFILGALFGVLISR